MQDWRGYDINLGDTVMYHFSHGRSATGAAQGEVIGFTPKKVRVKITHDETSAGWWSDDDARTCDPGKLTVINGLPQSKIKTVREQRIERAQQAVAARSNYLNDIASGKTALRTWETMDSLTANLREAQDKLNELINS